MSEQFKLFSVQESGHGKMFCKLYADHGGVPPARMTWVRLGKGIAFCQRILPLKWQLKLLKQIESSGVADIEQVLAKGKDDALTKILSAILPHERQHASLYDTFYHHY